MSVTIIIDTDTTDRELAAIACLIAVMRSDQPVPAPPLLSFDKAEDEPARIPAAAAAAPAPPAPPAPAAQPASEALIAAESERVAATPAPPAPAAAPVPAGDLDTDGLPWDARIHSTPATKNATDGRWRARRGLDETTKATVTAELKAKLAGTGEAAAAPLPPAEPSATDAATAFGAGGAGNASEAPPAPAAATPAPPAPAAAAAPAPPAPAEAPAAESGAIIYPQIVTMANDKGMTYDALNEISLSLGLQKFAELARRPDLFAMFVGAVEGWSPPAPAA